MSTPDATARVTRIFLEGIKLHEVRLGIRKPCVLKLQCNRKLFEVALIPRDIEPDSTSLRYGFDPGPFASKFSTKPCLLQGYNPTHAIEADYLRKLDAGITESGILDEAGNKTFNEIHNLVLTTAENLIRELAGKPVEPTARETLEEALNPEKFWLEVVTIEGRLSVVRRDDFTGTVPTFEPQDISGVSSALPVVSWSQIEILETIRPQRAYKVLVEGQVLFCKVTGRGYELPSISRDAQVLQQIKDTGLDRKVNVPRLEGLIDQGLGGEVIGILTSWIEARELGGNLDYFREFIGAIAMSRREKWIVEIENAVEQLHNSGLVWGDAASRNVIIDKQDNAWIVDFGGGFNWDVELMDTEAGDRVGLRQIAQYLQVA